MRKSESRKPLKDELAELGQRLAEAEQTLKAIQNGEVDALVVKGEAGDQVYTLKSAEHPYRVMIEQMNEGALTLSVEGIILYANQSFAQMVEYPLQEVIASPISKFIELSCQSRFHRLMKRGGREEIYLRSKDNSPVPIYAALNTLTLSEEGVTGYSLVVTDLSEQKRTEQIMAAEKLARTLLEQAADAIIVCDMQGTIIRASTKALELLGTALEGRQFDEALAQFYPVREMGKTAAQKNGYKAVSLASLHQGEVLSGSELSLIKDDVPEGSFIISFSPLSGNGKSEVSGFSISLTDITQRKKAEEALMKAKEELEIKVKERTKELSESEEKYRRVVENAHEAIAVTQDERLKLFNPQALELFGYSAPELLQKRLSDLIYQEDLDLVLGEYRARLSGEKPSARYEHRIVGRNGRIKWVMINSVLMTWEGRPATLVMLADITPRKNMEKELKTYARRITQVQEEERKRIAYELHDDTAQYLAILKLELDSIINSGKIQDPKLLGKLQYLEKDAGRAVDDVRRYSHELRPGVLEHLGLQAALEQIAEDQNKVGQIHVEMNAEGFEPEMPEDVKLGFFRIAQEAINNSRKHAKATTASINLVFNEDQVQMRVRDEGVGFDVSKASARMAEKGSLGMMSMQERANLIGAMVKIESAPGRGTTITVEAQI